MSSKGVRILLEAELYYGIVLNRIIFTFRVKGGNPE